MKYFKYINILLWIVVLADISYSFASVYYEISNKPSFKYKNKLYDACKKTTYNGSILNEEKEYIQKTPISCGVSAMKYILKYYSIYINESEIAKNILTKGKGSSMLSMKRLAEKYGLRSYGYRLGLKEIKKLKCPYIAYINSNHWVVILWVKDDKVVLIDPLYGRVLVDQKDFIKVWKGEILTFDDK